MTYRRQISQVRSITSLILLLAAAALTGCKAQSRPISTTKFVEVRGAVKKPGRYIIKDGDTITFKQALELAGGLSVSPLGVRAVILRHENRSTIPVNLIALLVGKVPDIKLVPGDTVIFERILLFDTPLQEPHRRTSATTS
jgi:hypothetical protein